MAHSARFSDMPHTETPRRPPLLFVPDARGRSEAEVLSLSEDEARHVRALRLEESSLVRLADGAGGLWSARLRGVDGRCVSCVLEERLEAKPPLPVELAFGVANKSHTLWLVEKATEFGVASLWPVEFSRSRSVADAARSPSFWRKAERRSISSMKQSGGAWLPRFEPPRELPALLDSLADARAKEASGADGGVDRVLLDQSGDPLGEVVEAWQGRSSLTLLVGPEGGVTDAEKASVLGCGFRPARLGPLILRFETAGIAAVAVAAQQLEIARAERTAALPAPQGGGDLHER